MTSLTPELFEKACNGSIPAGRVTPQMIEMALLIPQPRAKAIASEPGSSWWKYEEIEQIEAAIPGCRDRHIQAILEVASVYGDDGMDSHSRVY